MRLPAPPAPPQACCPRIRGTKVILLQIVEALHPARQGLELRSRSHQVRPMMNLIHFFRLCGVCIFLVAGNLLVHKILHYKSLRHHQGTGSDENLINLSPRVFAAPSMDFVNSPAISSCASPTRSRNIGSSDSKLF